VQEFNGLVSIKGQRKLALFTLISATFFLHPDHAFFLPEFSFFHHRQLNVVSYLYAMSKVKSAFFCSNCGYESAKWVGKCPSCQQWNTFIEEIIQKDNTRNSATWKEETPKHSSKIVSLNEIEKDHNEGSGTEQGTWRRNSSRVTHPGSRRTGNREVDLISSECVTHDRTPHPIREW
jgi:Rubredoxin metal binding domain